MSEPTATEAYEPPGWDYLGPRMLAPLPDPVCYVDLDGVLADFVAGALALHRKSLPRAEVRWHLHEQIGLSAEEFWSPLGFQFWAGLPWTAEGRELLAGLEEEFGERVVLMTSPCETGGSVEGKVAWVKRNLPAYSRRLFVGPCKHLAASPGKLLLDDHGPNCELFASEGGMDLLVPRPWNDRRGETDAGGNFDVPALLAQARQVFPWIEED